jgi:hypothetical protein
MVWGLKGTIAVGTREKVAGKQAVTSLPLAAVCNSGTGHLGNITNKFQIISCGQPGVDRRPRESVNPSENPAPAASPVFLGIARPIAHCLESYHRLLYRLSTPLIPMSPSRNSSSWTSALPPKLQNVIATIKTIPTSVAIILGIILGLFVSQWISNAVRRTHHSSSSAALLRQ